MPLKLAETSQATFSEAKKYCEKESMQISILDSASEADKFKNYLKYIGEQC
jgi:hypothetical protein